MCREGGVGVEARLIQPNPGSGASPSDVATPFSCLQTTLVFLLHQDSANWSHVFGLMAIVIYSLWYALQDLLDLAWPSDLWLLEGVVSEFNIVLSLPVQMFAFDWQIGLSLSSFTHETIQTMYILYAVGTPHDPNTHVPLVAEFSSILLCRFFLSKYCLLTRLINGRTLASCGLYS